MICFNTVTPIDKFPHYVKRNQDSLFVFYKSSKSQISKLFMTSRMLSLSIYYAKKALAFLMPRVYVSNVDVFSFHSYYVDDYFLITQYSEFDHIKKTYTYKQFHTGKFEYK